MPEHSRGFPLAASISRRLSLMSGTLLPALVLVVLWLLTLQPLIQPGMMTCSHDGMLHFLRAFQLDVMVRQGIVWPRWTPGMVFGYGYPLFNYYPPLALYPILILHRLGFSLLQGWNLTCALGILASGLTMYLWAHEVTGPRGGLIAAVAYMFAPYQLYDAYWRGNVTEQLTLPVLPVVMWAALRVSQTRRWLYVLIGALSYAAILLTHAPAGLMFTPVLLTYLVVLAWRAANRRMIVLVSSMLVLGVGLAAFFLVPAFLEKEQVQFWRAITPAGQNFRNHFLSVSELFAPAPASDPLLVNPSPPRSLGWAVGALAAIGVLTAVMHRMRLHDIRRRHVVWAAPTLAVIILMMLPISEPIWSHVPLLPFIQFPWRFLGVGSLLAGLLAGVSLAAFDDESGQMRNGILYRIGRTAIGALGIAMLVAGAAPWIYPRLCAASANPTQAAFTAIEVSTGLIGTTSSGEYLPAVVQEWPTGSPFVEALRAGQSINRWDAPGARIVHSRDDGLSAELVLESDAPVQVVYRAFYFPGWEAWLDGWPVSLSSVPPLGLMAVNVPAGRHTLMVRFGSTPLRTASECISLAAALTIIVIGIFDLRSVFVSRFVSASQSVRLLEWLALVALGVALLAFKLVVADRYDTMFRWRRWRDGQFVGAMYRSDVTIAGRARLLGYDVHPQSVSAGGVVYVDLYWTLLEKLNFRAAVRLLDEHGLEWSSKDELNVMQRGYSVPPPSREWPPGTWADDRHAVHVLAGTPPGEYLLVAVPFHPDTLDPLPVSVGESPPGGYPGVVVGRLRVESPASPPQTLDLSSRVNVPLGELLLLGYSQDREQTAPGQGVLLVLGWQARRKPRQDYMLRLELVTPEGQAITQLTHAPGGERYPTRLWAAGEIIRSQVLVHIPGRTGSGQYVWRAALLDESGAAVGQAVFGQLHIAAPQRDWAAPAITRRIGARLGDWVMLFGVDAPDSAAPGQPVSITLVWQAIHETNQDYKVFVHLLNPDGQLAAQSDAVPAAWTRPTSGWQAGEYVIDVHTITLKGSAAPGEYRLLSGMYDSRGQRLSLTDGSDAVELGTLKVIPR